MLKLVKELIGKDVSMTYIPVPYLGRGIVEPVVVEGKLESITTMNGRNYVNLKDAEGKLIISKDVMEIEVIEEAKGSTPAPEARVASTPIARQRVGRV